MDNVASSREFISIMQYIEEISGIVLNEQNTHLLANKLDGFFNRSLIKDIEELYVNMCIKKDMKTIQLIIESITTNETFWFRDKALWLAFEAIFLPEWVEKLTSGDKKTIKIWSAACSSGQEPYSVAMTIENFLTKSQNTSINLESFEILATDISRSILKEAEAGIYDRVAMSRGIQESDKIKYFNQNGKHYEIIQKIRRAVTFKQTNLIDSNYGFEQFDIILFRNVLIYFSDKNKKEIYQKIARSLKKDGKLCIGSSELISDESQIFSRVQYNDSVFFTKAGGEEIGRRII